MMNDVRFVINRRETDSYLRLYSIQQEQKKFEDRIILQIDFDMSRDMVIQGIDSLQFRYWIPPYIQMLIGTSINVLTKLVEPHLICESLDVFTIHFITLEVLSKELNVKNIGVCVSEEIENLVLDKFDRNVGSWTNIGKENF
jgi:hypothetical protein